MCTTESEVAPGTISWGARAASRFRSRLASPAPAQDLDAVEQAFEAEEEVRVVDGVGRRRGRALEQARGDQRVHVRIPLLVDQPAQCPAVGAFVVDPVDA